MKIAKTLDGKNLEIDLKKLVTERTFICSMTRYGKCGQFEIILSDGTIKKVKDIKVGDKVLSLDNNYKIVLNKVLGLKDNGIKSVYEIITNDGRKVKVTKIHPFLTKEGKWKPLKEMSIGDYVALPRNIPVEGVKKYDINKIKILGYLLGDGCLTARDTTLFSNSNKKILNEMRKILPKEHYLKYLKEHCYAIRTKSHKKNSHKINKLIKEYGLSKKNSHTKFIPNFIFNLKNKYISTLLNRMFACDGWASISGSISQIGYCSVSTKMINQIQHLLLRLGILSSISKKKVKYKKDIRIAYQLSINGKENILKFIKDIGIYSKENALNKIKELYKSKGTNDSGDKIPKSFIKSNKLSHYLYKSKRKYNTNKNRECIGRKTIQAYSKEFKDSYLKSIGYSDIIWRKIKEINYLYEDMVYDISVEKNHNFIANDFFVHNSYTIRKICEETFGKVGIIILDPEGEYVSLREKYPFLIIGRDIPLDPETAGFLAEQVLKENLSVIIDSSTVDTIDEQDFATNFINKFMELELKKKKSYLFIIEESDEFCLTSDTEILTKEGWKDYKKIKEGELVLTLDTKKNISEWNIIQKVIIKNHSGKLIHLKNKSTDILATLDHRILCQNSSRNTPRKGEKYYYKDYEYRQSKNLTSQFRIPCAREINNNKKSKYGKDVIKLIAWIITEGSIYSKKKSKDKRGYISITQSFSKNPKNCKEIVNLLKKLNYKYYSSKRKRVRRLPSGIIKEGIEWDFYLNKESSHKIFKIMDDKIHEIPIEFLNLSLYELKTFFNTLMKGDGTNKSYLTRVGKERRIQEHSSFYPGYNLRLANQFQYLTQLLGFRSVLSKINNQWRISISKNPNSHFKSRNIKKINYRGIVWDIRTQNGNFVARRNGKSFITGNCPEKGVYKAGSLRSVINLSKKGAKRGIGLILASQRPAMISKFVLSQCANQIVGHTEWSGDRKVLQQYLRIENSIMDKIPELKAGEFYFRGNFIDEQDFAKVNSVITTHLGATPSIRVPTAPQQLREIVDKLSKSLPKVIEEKLKPSLPDKKAIEGEIRQRIEKEFKKKIDILNTKIKTLEKSKVSDEEVENIINERVEKEVDEYKGKFQEQDIKIRDYKKFISSMVSKGKLLIGEIKDIDEEETESPTTIEADYGIWLNKFSGGKKKVLELLVKHRRLTRSQLTIMTGLKKSNIVHNILPILKSAGLINYDSEKVELIGG